VIGLFFFGSILHKLRSLTSEEYSLWKLIKNVSMVITFILAFAFTFTFMGIYQVTLAQQEDQDRAAYDEYIQCIIQRWWKTSFPGSFPAECTLANHPDLVFMDIQSACFASMGIVTFLVFGSPHSKTIYKQLSGVMRRCCGVEEPERESREKRSGSMRQRTQRGSGVHRRDSGNEPLINHYRNQDGNEEMGTVYVDRYPQPYAPNRYDSFGRGQDRASGGMPDPEAAVK